MNAMERFTQLAQSAISQSEQFANAVAALTAEQKSLVDSFSKAVQGLDKKAQGFREGAKAQIELIEKTAHEQIERVKKEKDTLREEFEKACVQIGLKKESIPLAEYQVVQKIDQGAKKILSGIGAVRNYIRDGVNQGK